MFHLAASVGGIGANAANPGRLSYDDMAMGLHVIKQARRAGVEKLILVGTTCSYPKHTPTPFREEFLYVEDAAEGLTLAALHYDGSEPVNLGSGEEISIRDLAALIARIAGFRGEIRWDASRPDGQPCRLETSRAGEAFGFAARTPLEVGLRFTVDWYVEDLARRAVSHT